MTQYLFLTENFPKKMLQSYIKFSLLSGAMVYHERQN